MTMVWMPMFICFSMLWFPRRGVRKASPEVIVSRERTIAALTFMSAYLLMLFIFVLIEVYGFRNRPELFAVDLPKDLSRELITG